jgi:hypothetical protein
MVTFVLSNGMRDDAEGDGTVVVAPTDLISCCWKCFFDEDGVDENIVVDDEDGDGAVDCGDCCLPGVFKI